MNHLLGHPQGRFVYQGEKKKIGLAMQYAGVQHLAPFERPVDLWFFPRVIYNKSGRIPKMYDCVNFGPTCKSIEDWLVKFGKLRNDSREYVWGCHTLRAELAEDGIPGMALVITEQDGEPFPIQAELELEQPAPF